MKNKLPVKYTSHFNRLRESELERLAILAEECGEVIQVINKIIRHGYDSCDPTMADMIKNRQLLEKEIGDVMLSLDMMVNAKDVNLDNICHNSVKKSKKIGKWLHHQN